MTEARPPYDPAGVELMGQLRADDVRVLNLHSTAQQIPSAPVDRPLRWIVTGVRFPNLVAAIGTLVAYSKDDRAIEVVVAPAWRSMTGDIDLPPGTDATYNSWLSGPAADAAYLHARQTLLSLAALAGEDVDVPREPIAPTTFVPLVGDNPQGFSPPDHAEQGRSNPNE